MRRAFLTIFLALSVFPISHSLSQVSDVPPTLGIKFVNYTPFHYKAEDGKTVIVGEVENTKNFPVTRVIIWTGFYNDISKQPLESTRGTTILDVIPPFSKSPYMIKSPSPNAAITGVSVNLLGFNSAAPKQTALDLQTQELSVGNQLELSGSITNNGESNSTNTRVHIVFYDAFDPPRILWIGTTTIEGDIEPGITANFEFDEKYNPAVVSIKLLAESSQYNAEAIKVTVSPPSVITKLVTISDVSATDSDGNKLSDIRADSTINIQSGIWIQYSAEQESYEQPYVYYIQIKQSGEDALIEFIGKHEGMFDVATKQFPSVEWTPERKGLYFIETFVWDPDGVPLASKGPIMLVLVT